MHDNITTTFVYGSPREFMAIIMSYSQGYVMTSSVLLIWLTADAVFHKQ